MIRSRSEQKSRHVVLKVPNFSTEVQIKTGISKDGVGERVHPLKREIRRISGFSAVKVVDVNVDGNAFSVQNVSDALCGTLTDHSG